MRLKIYLFFFFKFYLIFGDSCFNWNSRYECQSNDNYEFPETWDERAFQTPPKNDIYNRYKSTYQDMHYLVGYAQLKYSSDKNKCTIKFITKVNPKLGTLGKDYKIVYRFGDIEQTDNTIILTSSNKFPNGMKISAKIYDIRIGIETVKLELEDEYFIWDNPKINQSSEYKNGQIGSIVELFGWPYEDIEEECEFLSHAGYMGLKIYSPNEHLFNYKNVEDEMLNPWWYINQPVSYKLDSRMGNRKQLKKMINKCRSYNLRIYADIVINHMTGDGYDMYDDHRAGDDNDCFHWNEKGSTAGSPFWNIGYRYENNPYTGLEPGIEFPSVPYFPSDFHCKNEISNWGNSYQLNSGWLDGGLADLNTEKESVQQRIVDYFIELISIGFSGISIQNAKHIFPLSFANIFKKLKDNLGGQFPEDFIAILQLIFGNEKQIMLCNEDELSSFGDAYFLKLLKNNNLTDDDINKIKIWNSGFPNEMPKCLDNNWRITPQRHVISIENPNFIYINSQDNKNYYIYIRDKDIEKHRNLTINMFNNTEFDWKIKCVFSTFSLINGSIGFPDGKSDCNKCQSDICKKYCTHSFPYQKAYDPNSKGYDTGNKENWKEGTYTRVHRDLKIINSMRKWMNLSEFTEEELYNSEKLKSNCELKCLTCNNESKKNNLCLICNKSKGFYPLILSGEEQEYYECLNSTEKYERIYFNKEEEAFKSCYESCKLCDREGNSEIHNCLSCEVDLIERPNSTSVHKNCVTNCTYSYYISFGQYRCTEIPHCPIEANKYIKEKNQCIEDCKKDEKYKYLYNGICLENCPNNTNPLNFLCKEKDFDKCSLSEKEIQLINFKEEGGMSAVVKSYIDEFSYTTKHISKLNNKNYKMIIYRDEDCINELSLQIPKIYFGECYNKAKASGDINERLIIIYVEKIEKDNTISSYSLYNPTTGEKIDAESLCKNDLIIIEENIEDFFNDNLPERKNMKSLIDQGINIFNISEAFYTDICYHYESPKKKDMTLKDRVLEYYPNITFCDPGCEYKGINLTTMTIKCFCRFNDIINNDLVKEYDILGSFVNDTLDIIYSSNIEVFLCFKYIFKNFKKTIGGYIIFYSILICIAFTLFFYLKEFNKLKKYIQELTDDYLSFLNDKSNSSKEENFLEKNKGLKLPPIFRYKSFNYQRDKENKLNIKFNEENESKIKEENNNNKSKDDPSNIEICIFKNKPSSRENILKKEEQILKDNKLNIKNNKNKSNNKNKEDFFKDYLSVSLDDLDYEDAMKKENRKFCEYFLDSIIDRQIIGNTFFSKEPLRPFSIKIILFILNLILYFVVNGLFYSEDYISEIYHSENENFFSFFPRSINRIVYTTIVSIFIAFLIDCFFIEEKKIKGIFNREKDNFINLKKEISKLILIIRRRYLSFIILVFFLLIFFWVYLMCFNSVYPYTQIDWIKSSIVIIIITQILSVLRCLGESILRYISLYFKSEKIFRVSKLIN